MDLGILAHDLFTNKKIGKALYSKMMNSTYNRTREETLKSNIDALNSIQDKIQLSYIIQKTKSQKIHRKTRLVTSKRCLK